MFKLNYKFNPIVTLITFYFLSVRMWIVAMILDLQVKALVVRRVKSWLLQKVNGIEDLNFRK